MPHGTYAYPVAFFCFIMIHLDCVFKGKKYHFRENLWLITSKKINNKNDDLFIYNKKCCHKKVKNILDYIAHPYKLSIAERCKVNFSINKNIKIYVSLLIWLYKNLPFGLTLIRNLRLNIFENAIVASEVFKICHPQDQNVLCLPRSIFIATTSKRFKEHGAMVIGIFLPTRHMHAWIIEDNHNPTVNDVIWTNYTPMAMMI